MLFKDDPIAQAHWKLWARLKAAAGAADAVGTNVSISVSDAQAILNAPSYADLLDRAEASMEKGSVVGDILILMKAMALAGVPDASLSKAVARYMAFAASKGFSTSSFGNGKALPASRPTIFRYWKHLAPVAHLWAARNLAVRYGWYLEPGQEPLAPEHFGEFLCVAKGMQDFLIGFKPSRQSGGKTDPLVDVGSIWQLPADVPPMDVDFSVDSQREIAYYRAHTSNHLDLRGSKTARSAT